MQSGVSNKFTVSIVEDGESAPSYVKTSYAWSVSYEKPNGADYPTDIAPTSWSETKPSMPANKPACWVREQLYNWYEPNRTYVLVQTTYRCETAKPQVFDVKGYVIYVQDGSGFPTSPTPESRALALVTNDGNPYIYLNSSWQRGGETAAVNDAYMVSNPDATYDGKSIYGHLFVWNGSLWKDMGEIKGPPGENGQDACTAYMSNNTISFDTDYRGKINGARSAVLIDVSYLKGTTRLAPTSISINGSTINGETQVEQNFFVSIVNSSTSTATLSLYCKSIYSTVELDLSQGMKNYPVILSYTDSPNVNTTLYVKGNIPTIVSTDYYYYVTDASTETATDSKTGLALRSVPLSAWSRQAELPTENTYLWQKTIITYSNGETSSSMYMYWRQISYTPIVKMGTVISDGTISEASYINGITFNLKPDNKIQTNQNRKEFYAELWDNGQKCRINRITVDIIYPDGTPSFATRQIGAYLGCSSFWNNSTQVYTSTPALPFYVNNDSETHYSDGSLSLTNTEVCNRIKFYIEPKIDYWVQVFKAQGEEDWSNILNNIVYRITLAGSKSTRPEAMDVFWYADFTANGDCIVSTIKYHYTCSNSSLESSIRLLNESCWVPNKEDVPLGTDNRYLWQRERTIYKGSYYEDKYSLIDEYDSTSYYTLITDAQESKYSYDTVELNPSDLVLDEKTLHLYAYASIDGAYPVLTNAYMQLLDGYDEDANTHRPTVTVSALGVMAPVTIAHNDSRSPKGLGWYELFDANHKYIKTVDVTIQTGKSYFQISRNSSISYTPTKISPGEYNMFGDGQTPGSIPESWNVVGIEFEMTWEKDEYLNIIKQGQQYINKSEFNISLRLVGRNIGADSDQYTTYGTFSLNGLSTNRYNEIDVHSLFTGATTLQSGKLHGLFVGTTAVLLGMIGGFVKDCGYSWTNALLPGGSSSDLSYDNLSMDIIEDVGGRKTLYRYVFVLNIGDKTTTLIKRYKIILSDTIVEINS